MKIDDMKKRVIDQKSEKMGEIQNEEELQKKLTVNAHKVACEEKNEKEISEGMNVIGQILMLVITNIHSKLLSR